MAIQTRMGLVAVLSALALLASSLSSALANHNFQPLNFNCFQLLDNRSRANANFLYNQYKDLKPLYDHKIFLCLLAKRLKIGIDVAGYKYRNKVAILDISREQAILAAVVYKAQLANLDRVWSTEFFADQMVANRQIQQKLIEQWKCSNTTSLPDVDLYRVIRPQIDLINNELIQLAKQTLNFRKSDWCYPVTEFEMVNVDFDYGFDLSESLIFQNAALRHVCI